MTEDLQSLYRDYPPPKIFEERRRQLAWEMGRVEGFLVGTAFGAVAVALILLAMGAV